MSAGPALEDLALRAVDEAVDLALLRLDLKVPPGAQRIDPGRCEWKEVGHTQYASRETAVSNHGIYGWMEA